MTAKTYPTTSDGIVDYGPASKGDRTWKRWGIDITLHRGAGGRIRKRYRTKAEADAKRDELRRAKSLGTGANVSAGARTNFTTLFRQFMQSPAIRKTSERNRSDLDEHWRNLLQHDWGMRTLDTVTYAVVSSWAATLADRHSVKRQRDAIKLLTRLLNYAVGEGYLLRNPAFRPNGDRDYMPAETPSSGDSAKHALTGRQLRRLASATPLGRFSDIVLFAGTTGLRWQEWARLEVQDVDVRKRTVSVTKALSTVRGKGHSFRGRAGLIDGPTKTHETRTVPVLPDVLEAIGPRLDNRRDALLFGGRGDMPTPHTTVAKAMREGSAQAGTIIAKAQAEAGLAETGYLDDDTLAVMDDDVIDRWGLQLGDEDFRPLAPHGLRHTAITGLINSGVPLTAVQRWAGHKSPTVTLNTYSHLYSSDLSDAAVALADWLDRD